MSGAVTEDQRRVMPEELSYPRAASRIARFMWILAGAGILVAFLWYGWQSAAGFALGAALSGLNFRWLRKMIESVSAAALATAPGQDPPRKSGILLGFRYLLLGGSAYVILKLSPISLTAVLVGIFVETAAVFVEVTFEVFYARK